MDPKSIHLPNTDRILVSSQVQQDARTQGTMWVYMYILQLVRSTLFSVVSLHLTFYVILIGGVPIWKESQCRSETYFWRGQTMYTSLTNVNRLIHIKDIQRSKQTSTQHIQFQNKNNMHTL